MLVIPPHAAVGAKPELVAFLILYEVLLQVFPETNVIAAEQLSLLGAWPNDLNEKIDPSSKRIVVAKGYWKRFIV